MIDRPRSRPSTPERTRRLHPTVQAPDRIATEVGFHTNGIGPRDARRSLSATKL